MWSPVPSLRTRTGRSPSAGWLGAVRTLILGGTAWLGRHLALEAAARGHDVTCLARGSAPVPENVRLVRADRNKPGAYAVVRSEHWDLALDVSRQPGQVRTATAAVADVAFFVFVSSANVYADHGTIGQDESAAVLPPLDADVMETMASYGEAKVACERHVRQTFGPDRCLIARVGLIGGPGDLFDRSGYWPLRFARPARADGSVLVPESPELPTQVIDVRDLADWLVGAGERRVAGTFNAGGETVSFADHLEVARAVAGHRGPVVEADSQWLVDHGVEPWMGRRSLPLWLPDPAWRGFNARDSRAARRAGLLTRPLAETLADTLAWELTRDPFRTRLAGLSDSDERSLLAELSPAPPGRT